MRSLGEGRSLVVGMLMGSLGEKSFFQTCNIYTSTGRYKVPERKHNLMHCQVKKSLNAKYVCWLATYAGMLWDKGSHDSKTQPWKTREKIHIVSSRLPDWCEPLSPCCDTLFNNKTRIAHTLSYEKTLMTFYYADWFIGILILVYQNPHITG